MTVEELMELLEDAPDVNAEVVITTDRGDLYNVVADVRGLSDDRKYGLCVVDGEETGISVDTLDRAAELGKSDDRRVVLLLSA